MRIVAYIFGVLLLLYVFYCLIVEIKENYESKEEDPVVRDLAEKLRTIDPRVDKIVPKLRFYKGDKSYTIDKKHVHLCMADKKTNEIYPMNQLILVLLHEIAHAICIEVGHTALFHQIYEELLLAAELAGLYDDSIPHIDGYCE